MLNTYLYFAQTDVDPPRIWLINLKRLAPISMARERGKRKEIKVQCGHLNPSWTIYVIDQIPD
jgi:hypothetical protein